MIVLDDRILNEVNESETWLLLQLAKRAKAGKGKTVFPSNMKMMKDTGWGEKKLKKVKNSLIEKGIISRKRRVNEIGRQTSNNYEILTDKVFFTVSLKDVSSSEVQDDYRQLGGVKKNPLPPCEKEPPLRGGQKEPPHIIKQEKEEITIIGEQSAPVKDNSSDFSMINEHTKEVIESAIRSKYKDGQLADMMVGINGSVPEVIKRFKQHWIDSEKETTPFTKKTADNNYKKKKLNAWRKGLCIYFERWLGFERQSQQLKPKPVSLDQNQEKIKSKIEELFSRELSVKELKILVEQSKEFELIDFKNYINWELIPNNAKDFHNLNFMFSPTKIDHVREYRKVRLS